MSTPKSFPTLYSRTSTGAIQQWTIEVDLDRYRTTYGQIDGKKTTTGWTVSQPTNVGRSNYRSGEKQAVAEATSIWKDKRDSGCWEDINNIDKVHYIEPMLAQNFEDRKDEITYPIYTQPKLDGIRCIVTSKGMQSRNGKPIVSCPHILIKLIRSGVFEKYPNIQFDGELYCDKLNNDFNKITSLVKKSKPTENDLMESDATIQYWIYDIIHTSMKFSVRNQVIQSVFKEFELDKLGCFVQVPTIRPVSKASLDTLYESWIEHGYEGQMVRQDEVYQQKRSAYLLKRKEFQDREYPIVKVMEGEGNKTGMAGYIILRNDNGETFKSNIKGDRKYLKSLLVDAENLVGRLATVKFFNLTPDKQVPRFPYVIKIRESFDIIF